MTLEQEALLRKAKDSLRGARVLADQKLYDFAVSRAYYTMFYVAEAFLLGEGLAFPNIQPSLRRSASASRRLAACQGNSIDT